jgi:hypothetical protein
MIGLGEPDRLRQLLAGRLQVASQQVHPAQHRSAERLPPRLAGLPGERRRLLQQPERSWVVGPVALDRAEVGRGLRLQRGRARGTLERVAEPALGPVVACAQEVHVAQLGPSARHRLVVAGQESDLVGLVQRRQPGLVQPAERVDQCLGEHQP